jgi:hypothetical protein
MRSTRVKALIASSVLALGVALSGCTSDADVVSDNISKDADNFKINRRVIFYNGIKGEYLLVIEGFCSVDPGDSNRMTVTCKLGENNYKKHFLGKSDNVTWFAEQIQGANVSKDHYKVIFNPSTIVPDVEAR